MLFPVYKCYKISRLTDSILQFSNSMPSSQSYSSTMANPIPYRQELDALFNRINVIEQLIQVLRPIIPIIHQMRTEVERLSTNNSTNADNISHLTDDFGTLNRRLAPMEADVAESPSLDSASVKSVVGGN